MTSVTLAEVVSCARGYIGAPFRHQGRARDTGVDCVGLVICVARELGLVPPDLDVNGYPRQPDGRMLMREAEAHMVQVPKEDLRPGHVVVVALDGRPRHMGIVVPYRHGGLSMVHSSSQTGRVDELRLLFGRYMQFRAAFCLPGVE